MRTGGGQGLAMPGCTLPSTFIETCTHPTAWGEGGPEFSPGPPQSLHRVEGETCYKSSAAATLGNASLTRDATSKVPAASFTVAREVTLGLFLECSRTLLFHVQSLLSVFYKDATLLPDHGFCSPQQTDRKTRGTLATRMVGRVLSVSPRASACCVHKSKPGSSGRACVRRRAWACI